MISLEKSPGLRRPEFHLLTDHGTRRTLAQLGDSSLHSCTGSGVTLDSSNGEMSPSRRPTHPNPTTSHTRACSLSNPRSRSGKTTVGLVHQLELSECRKSYPLAREVAAPTRLIRRAARDATIERPPERGMDCGTGLDAGPGSSREPPRRERCCSRGGGAHERTEAVERVRQRVLGQDRVTFI